MSFVLQSAGSTAVACARLRGAPFDVGLALRTWLGRLPALAAHAVIRALLEGLPCGALVAAAVAAASSGGDDRAGLQLLTVAGVLPLLGALYPGFRAFFGLAFACVADGPRSRRSARARGCSKGDASRSSSCVSP